MGYRNVSTAFLHLYEPRDSQKLAFLSCKYFAASQKRAKELNQAGALFAWRTIDGNETSAYYPAGTAQLHINADIVYGFQLYERITGDQPFIEVIGKEVVLKQRNSGFIMARLL